MAVTLPLTTTLNAVTTGTGNWVPVFAQQIVVVTFTSVGTTSGGTLLIEETDDVSSAATPSLLYTQLASGFTGGAKLAVHLAVAGTQFIRVRVSSTITGGGTVTVTVAGA